MWRESHAPRTKSGTRPAVGLSVLGPPQQVEGRPVVQRSQVSRDRHGFTSAVIRRTGIVTAGRNAHRSDLLVLLDQRSQLSDELFGNQGFQMDDQIWKSCTEFVWHTQASVKNDRHPPGY